jgi:hypothetical protein
MDPRRGRIETAYLSFRGRLATSEIDNEAVKYRASGANWCEWLPHSLSTSLCDIPSPATPVSATLLMNCSAITVLSC